MKKNWIRIIVAALFICANIATFLFAQGKVKIVEKIVTVYKEGDTKQDKLPVSSGEVPKPAGLAKVGITGVTGKSNYDFNDSNYLVEENSDIDDKEILDADVEGGTFAEDNVADGEAIESKSEDETNAGVSHFNIGGENELPDRYSSDMYSDIPSQQNRYTDIADETIPIPQLPLCDTDFEGDVNVGGSEDILLPQLPDIS